MLEQETSLAAIVQDVIARMPTPGTSKVLQCMNMCGTSVFGLLIMYLFGTIFELIYLTSCRQLLILEEDSGEFVWLPTKWLEAWLKSPQAAPPLDCSALICSHGAEYIPGVAPLTVCSQVGLAQSLEAKRISIAAWRLISKNFPVASAPPQGTELV